jgi:predicted lipoprotein with Yx(FWY)xxD motif
MHHKTTGFLFAAMVVAVLFAASAWAEDSSVKVMKKDGIGSYLTDSKGMTLYYFAKDEPGKSACTGDCLTKWPLFKGESVSVADGLDVKSFGVLVRTEGNQATFKGYPLYYFFKDEKTGDTNGQGVNNVWYVIDPAKFPPAK